MDLDYDGVGTFKTELYTRKAIEIINNHDDKEVSAQWKAVWQADQQADIWVKMTPAVIATVKAVIWGVSISPVIAQQ